MGLINFTFFQHGCSTQMFLYDFSCGLIKLSYSQMLFKKRSGDIEK